MTSSSATKRIAIIGASSGLGESVALDFASRGWQVAIAARRDDRLREIAARAHGGNIIWEQIDVTAPDCVDRFSLLIERLGGVDTVLLCAGVGYQDPDATDSILVNTLEVNCVGFARLITAAYHHFLRSGTPGQIAVITSIAGTKGIGISAAYSASKRFESTYIDALDQLARTRRADICFTDIRPGFIRTALLSDSRRYPLEMTVAYASRRIVRAILRRRRVVIIDWRWRIIVALWRLIPHPIWRRLRLNL